MDKIKTIDQYTKLKYENDVKRITKELKSLENYIKSSDEILNKKKKQFEDLKKEAELLDKLKKYIN